jgi:hypothetical protein
MNELQRPKQTKTAEELAAMIHADLAKWTAAPSREFK